MRTSSPPLAAAGRSQARASVRGVRQKAKDNFMTRDWEIIRAILIRLEESETPDSFVRMKDFDGVSDQVVAYNMRLLRDAGCIEAAIRETSTGDNLIGAAVARRLTPKGHDLLDTIRNESVWAQIKEKFRSKGLDMTVDLVIGVGTRVIQSMLA